MRCLVFATSFVAVLSFIVVQAWTAQERTTESLDLTARPSADSGKHFSETKPGTLKSIKLNGDVELELAYIPAGEFDMGSPRNESYRYPDEKLHHVVITRPFMLGTMKITQEQYVAIMGKNPSHFIGNSLPVDGVTWQDAVDFCKKVSFKTGGKYRLPTEAEWEFACRAGKQTMRYWGEGDANVNDYAWNVQNAGGRTHDVGLLKSNRWGLYDINGNVWEWCSDYYAEYPAGPVTDPTGPKAADLAEREKAKHVSRGGCWNTSPNGCRPAIRGTCVPENPVDAWKHGFRVVLEIKATPAVKTPVSPKKAAS